MLVLAKVQIALAVGQTMGDFNLAPDATKKHYQAFKQLLDEVSVDLWKPAYSIISEGGNYG